MHQHALRLVQIVVYGYLDRELLAPYRRVRQVGAEEEGLERRELAFSDAQALFLGQGDGTEHPGGDGVRHGNIQRCFSTSVGDDILPEPGLGEVLPDPLHLGKPRRTGYPVPAAQARAAPSALPLCKHNYTATNRSSAHELPGIIPDARPPLGLVFLAFRDIVVAEHHHAGVIEDVLGTLDIDSIVERDLVQLSLRLHVELLQLIEDLLQVEPVFGQDKDRLVHRREADLRLALGSDIYLDCRPRAWPRSG